MAQILKLSTVTLTSTMDKLITYASAEIMYAGNVLTYG